MHRERETEASSELAAKYGKLAQSAAEYTNIHYDDIAQGLSSADRTIRTFVAERPFVAVGMAIAMGYLVARTINGIR